MGSTATATTTTVTEPTTNRWHLAGIIAAPSLGAVILNGIGFFNMLGALGNSSLGETGAHWILAGGLELGIIGFAIAAFCLSLLNRPNKGSQVITWVLSLVSATIGFTHIAHTGDEAAVRWLVTLAPALAAGTWHWTLKNVKSEAAMMRAAIAARMDHARLDELAKTAAGPAKWIADARLANAANRSYRTQKAVALGVAPHRQRDVSETFVNGAVSVAAVLAEVRPIDVSVATITEKTPSTPALTQSLETVSSSVSETVSTDVSSSVSRSLETVSNPVHADGGDTVDGVSKAVSPSLETAPAGVSTSVSKTAPRKLETVSPSASRGVSRDAVDGVSDGVSTPMKTVSDAVSTGVSKSLETPRETVSKPSVSRATKKSRGQSRGQVDAATDAEIFARAAAGQKPPAIAAALGLGRSTVYKRLQAAADVHTPAYGIPVVQVDEHQS